MYSQQPKLDAKNLAYLEDSLSHEELAFKKTKVYATQLADTTVQNMANQITAHHQQQFQSILNYLNSHN